MDLRLSEEQLLLRETMREVCARYATPLLVREMEDDPVGYRADLWRELADVGVLGILVPEEHGGAGLTEVEAALVCEELGRSLCPSPFVVSSVLSARLIERGGSAEQQERLLPVLAEGGHVVTLAWVEPGRGSGPDGVQLRAERAGGGHRLSGSKILVPFASSADHLLAPARTVDGITLFLVDRAAPGLTYRQVPTLASDASYRVDFDAVAVAEEARLGPDGSGWPLFEDAMNDALIALAAVAVGGAARAHELGTAYAKERVQFDRPIGSFQAVAHPLAEMAMEIEGARVLVYEAASTRAAGGPLGPLAAMAKLYACDVFRRTTKVAHQVFGGIGFTREIDIQLYYRRAKQLEITWWGPRDLEERIARAELDGERPFVTVDGERDGSW